MYILWRRKYSTSSRLALGHSSRIKPSAYVVIPMPSFPQAEQCLLIVMHEFLHFILYVFVWSCHFREQSRVSSVHPSTFALPFPHLQLLLILSQLFLNCSSSLAHPRSRSLTFLDCVIRVDPGVPMRARAFVLHSCSNSSPVGNRSHTHVDETWSSLVARAQPNMRRSATVFLVPGMAMIFATHCILEFTSDVS